MTSKQEEFTNRVLAKLLQAQGIAADFEQRGGRKRMDVVAEVEGLRVVLEAETGFHKKAQAIKDADARLTQRLTTAVFAVCYPTGVTEETLQDANLTWTLRTRAGDSMGEWSEGGVSQLAQAVQQAPKSLSGADVAAQQLSDALDTAVGRLNPAGREALAKALDLPATKGGSAGSLYQVAAKRGMLVIATAMLFHHRVQTHLPAECPEGYDGNWPPLSAPACTEQEAVISAHQEAWRGILAVDYKPVFETGRTALAAIPSNPDTGQAVRALAQAVGRVSERISGLRQDLLGRIFHRVLDTARYDGSFYTSTAAAVLLATLALREQDANWGDPNAIANLRICDPACGTGTLLMAAAERIRDLRAAAAGQLDQEDEEILGLHLVEDVLWGYDVNLTATHMAASTLGMLSPATRFQRMNVHRTLLGVFDGVPYLGSIDFLTGQAMLAGWPSLVQQVATGEAAPPPPPQGLVIMNPPFTRDSLRHDQFSRTDELAIKEREKEVLSGQPHQAAARLSGSANAFMVLGDNILKQDAGTLAMILPTVMATNPAAFQTRRYLAHRFHIDTIVSSHDPDRIFFSENTSIGEILLICRRWNGDEPKPQTRVINLARNPATPLDALDAAARIEQASEEEANHPRDFTVQFVDAERIEMGTGQW